MILFTLYIAVGLLAGLNTWFDQRSRQPLDALLTAACVGAFWLPIGIEQHARELWGHLRERL